MKFQHIIEAVYFKAWAITEAGWWDIHRIVKPHVLGAELPAHVREFIATLHAGRPEADGLSAVWAEAEETPARDFFGNPIETMTITPEGTAIIPVCGPLLNHATLMDRLCGACSYQQIQNDLAVAAQTPDLREVLLKIGSPGGMCNGMIETARAILRVREGGIKVRAISDTLVGSAAYALASACDSLAITDSTLVGSIGTFTAVLDTSKAHEMAGLSVEVIKSGEYKGEVSGVPLSDKQRADLQRTVNYFGEQFRALVRQNRMIEEKLMQGQVFVGTDALENGFADALIEDLASGYLRDEDED